MPNTIRHCGCSCDSMKNISGARFQDSTYGPGNRVHTVGMDSYKCTVCGKITKEAIKKKESTDAKKEKVS